MSGDTPVDGRRARRDRSRQAIVDAAFALILEGKGPPSVDAVAERAGVSVSSVFRNFDGLVDLQQQALELFAERYSHLLRAVPAPGTDLDGRIAWFVDTRLALYQQAHPLLAMARARAFDHDTLVEAVARNRSTLADQASTCFAPELVALTPTDAADVVAIVDSLTSPEGFELMTRSHARTPEQIASVWTSALRTLIDYSAGLTPDVIEGAR